MSSERWNKVNELFYAALERDEENRSLFLIEACGGDESLQQEVESLLAAHSQAGNFIQTPAVENAIQLLAEDRDQLVGGEQIGAYKIIREIGRGGMGAVYLAERADQQYEKDVALKLVKRGMDSDQVLQRFRNERQILANFDHPNIARLLDGGSTQNGLPYFVMEYVEGQPIDAYCDSKNLTVSQRLELFRQVCAAVSYAHRHLVIHRDIKPSNILVTEEGVPKLLDFGIAKVLQPENEEETRATAAGLRLMTPDYASPEQVQGISVTTASDIYSLGVVLYELLTGHRPYRFNSYSALDMARLISETEPQMPSTVIHTVEGDNDKTTPESVSRMREGTPDRLSRRLRGDLDNIVLMAMRKEPPRRYPSVELFSEDIRRHLAGLPVTARKDTFAYRGSKFVRRNKIAVTVATFALLAIVVSAIIAGIIQWRANQQAKFLQEFGQEAARMEGIVRFAYLLPLHDINAERKMVEDRIKAIGIRMTNLGGTAKGPGHYAMGRGFMALQKYDEARKHFESAINEYDYKTSEVAYSYGLTLAMLYQIELESAVRITGSEQREMRMKEIQKEFKYPALSNIQEGRQASEYSDYASAIVEFLDEHYEKAIEKSEKAVQKIPWLYESERLEGESYRRIGRQFLDKGQHPEALHAFTKAEEAFESSIRKGSSDPLGYVGLCNVKSNFLTLHKKKGGPAETTYLAGKEDCQKALQADPRNVEALLALTTLNNQWVMYLYPREGTKPALEEAVRTAQQASRLLPSNARAHRSLGEAYFWLADYQYLTQTDPAKAVESGNQSFEKAIQLNPNDGDAYYFRAQIFQTLGQYLMGKGVDPRKALDQSQKFLKEAARLNPKSFKPVSVMGSVLATKAEYEAENGLDANKSLDSAILSLRKALQMNPNDLSIYLTLGWTFLTKGEYLSALGQNPQPALKEAREAYQKAAEIRPDYPHSRIGSAQAAWRLGEFLVDTKEDPSLHLKEARIDLDQVWSMDKSEWSGYAIRGEVELVAARWKILQQKSPLTEFRNSLHWLDRAVEVRGSSEIFEIWYSRARVYRWWAEWNLESKQSPDKEISLGLTMVSKAQKINPGSGEMIGMRGIFWLLQARSISNVAQRQELADKARASLEEALRMNRNLSHTFAPFLKEAETLRN